MKIFNPYILSTLLMLLLCASCSNENSETAQTVTSNGKDTIKATIAKSVSRTYMGSDGLTTYWSAGDELGIYTREGDANLHFVAETNSEAFDGTFSGDLNDGTPAYAYYPWTQQSASDPTAVELTLASEQDAASIADYDFKVMTNTLSRSSGDYELLFTGVMAAMNITIDATSTPLASSSLKSVKVQTLSLNDGDAKPVLTGDFTLDLTTGETSFSAEGNDYATVVWNEPHLLSDGKAQAYMFINPNAIVEGMPLVVTFLTDDGTTATATFSAAKDFEPNTMYSFDMVLSELADKVIYEGNPLASIKFLQSANDKLIKSSLYTGSGLNTGQDYTNSTTEYDIECSYNASEGVWEAVIPYLYDFSDLVASFTTVEADAKVYVGELEQISGESVNDFNNVVTYIVESASGVRQEAKVKVKNAGLPVVTLKGTVYSKETDFDDIEGTTTINIDGTDYTCGLRLRGNSTQNMPKKPYAIKLDTKASILGMPKHKRWVFLANWLDRTMLRNDMAFYLAQQTGSWAPRGKHVELVLNGEYVGNYLLGEQIKIDENRLNIADYGWDDLIKEIPSPTTSDVANKIGYLLECDMAAASDEIYFEVKSPVPFYVYIKDPGDASEYSGTGSSYGATLAYTYINDYFSRVGTALINNDWTTIQSLIDYQSYADYWLFSEITVNQESKHPKSVYMHKDAGGKLKAGPAWDFDWGTFISMDNITNNSSTAGQIKDDFTMKYTMWYPYLFKDPTFVAMVKSRWTTLKAKFNTSVTYLNELSGMMALSDTFNHMMWPCTGFNKEYPNFDETLSYDAAIDKMRTNINARIEWLDTQINNLN